MIASLVILALGVGYAVLMHGGDDPVPSSIALLIVACAALVRAFRPSPASGLLERDRAMTLAAFVFPAYVLFQLVPLPVVLLQLLSPTRAEMARALDAIGAGSSFSPIALSAPTTWMHLLRVAGYVLTFLTVRRISARSTLWGWRAAIPLMIIGVVEALWALTAATSPSQQVSGTYYSKNHFAGLLEMTLPLTAVYAFVALGRGRTRHGVSGSVALVASGLMAGSLATFVGITSSLSKGGALAMFASLLVMGLLAAGRRLSGRTRVATFAALVLATLLLFVFVTPSRLVEQFAVVVSDDQTEGRLPIWQNTMRLIAAYPAVGVGLGNFYPALLPYQTFGNGLAWVHAHNDYLQLLAELGVVFALLPIGLMLVALVRSVRSVFSAATQEARLLALACTGSLVAIGLHSLGDFNTYILANGLVLAWIGGIASTLLPAESRAIAVQRTRGSAGAYRIGVVVLGSLLLVWSGASLLFLGKYQHDAQAERRFCRFGICDSAAALAQFPENADGEQPPAPPAALVPYLRRDPADPSGWENLGAAFQSAGRTDLARICFSRALALAPNSPPILLMAADFHFDVKEDAAALALVARALRDSALFDRAAFAALYYRDIDVAAILETALPDRRSAQAYLHDLMRDDRPDDARRAWRWMVARGYADDVSARDYFGFALGKERGEAAAQDWAEYVAGRDASYAGVGAVFNGGFESDSSGSPFDWRIDKVAGVAAVWSSDVQRGGRRSLRLAFDGTANVADLGVSQAVYLPAGSYRVAGFVKTDGVSTDQGVRIGVVGAGLAVATADVRGSSDWQGVEQEFEMAAAGVVRVRLERKSSLKFDNLVKGVAWVDDVSLTRVE